MWRKKKALAVLGMRYGYHVEGWEGLVAEKRIFGTNERSRGMVKKRKG